VEEVKAEEIVN